MADMYRTANGLCSNSSTSSPQREPDEISVFLQQILLRSSPSSQHQAVAATADRFTPENREAVAVPVPRRISATEASSRLKSSSYRSFTASDAANMSYSSVGNLETDQDEYDYESEEAVEAIVEEMVPKPTPPRSSSKRSRAAEVHNLSEKRRRSRINEKMKALQNLIPNSNKTDKASMLDEAIEYLKQLQLQVQMLTMRNGLSLYPICLPGKMQPNQVYQMTTDISDGDKALNVDMAKAITVDRTISAGAVLSIQDNCLKQAPVADFSTLMGITTPLELESSIQDHLGPFPFGASSKEKVLPCQPLNDDHPQTSSTGEKYCLEAKPTSLIPFETRPSNPKETHLEACLPGGDHLL